MKAIPTMYNGRQYRSRLEARWAAMFDLLEWRVEYEPIDFNGWIPDFVILESIPIYVEIKPVFDFPKEIAHEIDKSGCDHDALILGMTLPVRGIDDQNGGLGWYRQDGSWGDAVYGLWNYDKYSNTNNRNTKNRIGFCHSHQGYEDVITGLYNSWCGGDILCDDRILSMWNKAGNATQWKRPQ